MPPKPKGRGRGAGRGRGKGRGQHVQQETRPGRATASTPDPPSSSESRPSLSQKSEQPEVAQTPQRKEQKPESVKLAPREELALTEPSATSSRSQPEPSSSNPVEQKQRKKKRGKGGEKREQQSADQGQKPASNLSGQEPVTVQTPASEKRLRPGGTPLDKPDEPDPAKLAAKVASSCTITHAIGHAEQDRSKLRPPRRPDFGEVGRPIRLYANFFKLQMPRNKFMCHYDVEIEPSKCPRHVNHQVIEALFRKYSKETFEGRRPAFDGQKNIYSIEKLPVGKHGSTLDVDLPREDGGRDRKFKVKIKFAANVNMTELVGFLNGQISNGKLPQDSIQSMDVVLRQQPNLCYTSVGRSFFPPPGTYCRPGDLGGGCEVWFGFYQSIRPSQWKTLLVNIDVSAKGFYKEQGMIEFMCETLNVRRDWLSGKSWKMNNFMRENLTAAIRGLRIETTHLGYKRKYSVTGISSKSANQHRFVVKNEATGTSSDTTVEKYFSAQYGIKLSYPSIPCLHVGKERYLPMEVCRLVPCQKRKLTDQQIANMIKKTARPANERQRDIQDWANEFRDRSESYLQKEFGMSMSTEMVQVPGRVLPPPTIQLGEEPRRQSGNPSRQELQPRDGSWDMRGKTFFKGSVIDHWAVFCYVPPDRCNEQALQNLVNQLRRFSRENGLLINNDPSVKRYIQNEGQTEAEFNSALRQNPGIQLFVAVIPDKGSTIVYESVKQTGDVKLGVPTQCIKVSRALDAKPQVCSNIALKINAKLGGVNHVVNPQREVAPLFIKPVIIFGADVTHPSPGDMKTPSIAAVVGSLDRHASRYCARVRVQKNREEIIKDLATMVKEILIQFYRNNNQAKPLKIIFYRDGVSEGQFDQVLKHEVRAVQEACIMLEKGYQPGITFVVVQKRHHARLFPADGKDARGKPGNVPPGTTVDQGITHPFEFDFYLCSHLGIQGTSKPAHYHVLYDDNGFKADSLQQLTYQLCHAFARCTKAVSMPAPAYYAHLTAFRARNHLADRPRLSDGDAESNLSSFTEAVTVNENMQSQMYFT